MAMLIVLALGSACVFYGYVLLPISVLTGVYLLAALLWPERF